MKRLYRGQKLWLPLLLSRITLYFFFMCLIVFSLYVVGNFQRFSEGTFRVIFKFMDFYFYSFMVLSLGNILAYTLWSRPNGIKGVLFYAKSSLQVLMILFLYILIQFLTALFNGN